MILILTGPIRSYKTTTLLRYAEQRDDCGGVLSPDQKSLRVLYNVRTKKSISWEKPKADLENDLSIGRFTFDPEAFTLAAGWLDDQLADPDVRQIILDEVGKLELKGEGWAPWLRSALPKLEDKTLIMVVRRTLLDEVIACFGMEEVSIVGKEYFTVK